MREAGVGPQVTQALWELYRPCDLCSASTITINAALIVKSSFYQRGIKEGDLTATYRINQSPKGRHDEPAKRQRKRPRVRKVMCLLVSWYHVATSVVILCHAISRLK